MISPALAYSHTVMHNSLGCYRVSGLPPVMCAYTPAKTRFVTADRLVTVDSYEQTWSRNSLVADQLQ